jgi:uncharacterized RDD family membrane protein YckC
MASGRSSNPYVASRRVAVRARSLHDCCHIDGLPGALHSGTVRHGADRAATDQGMAMSTLFCDQCGEGMPAIATFCGSCGARQEIADERAEVRVVALGRSAAAAPQLLPRVARADEPLSPPRVARLGEPPPPRVRRPDAPAPPALRRSSAATTLDDHALPIVPAPSPARGRVHRPPPSMADFALVPAPLGSRLGALLIDGVVNVLALALALGLYVAGLPLILIAALVLLTPLGWAKLLSRPGVLNGQTPGKHVAGIRVVPVEGGPLTFGHAVSREVLWKGIVIGGVGGLLVIPALLNMMWPLFDDGHRALHDKAARTLVVRA